MVNFPENLVKPMEIDGNLWENPPKSIVLHSKNGGNRWEFQHFEWVNYGKSPFLMGKSTINLQFSIANC